MTLGMALGSGDGGLQIESVSMFSSRVEASLSAKAKGSTMAGAIDSIDLEVEKRSDDVEMVVVVDAVGSMFNVST